MKSYDEACRIIYDEFRQIEPGTEKIDLLDSLNRVLAQDIFSDIMLPGFDNSSMDGIGIQFKEGNTKWKIISEISAGNFSETALSDDSAVLIMTGAKLPDGVNTVIPVEDILIENNTAELITGAVVKDGQNIRKAGQDLKENELVAAKFTVLNSAYISILAACGVFKVTVFKKYNFGVFATGDELIESGSKCADDKVYASNLYSVIALLKEFRMDYTSFGICNDNKYELREKFYNALYSNIDILITTGGVSVGKYDFVMDTLNELGAEIIFWKVNIKPGKPLLFAKITINGVTKLIFGLPGNPVSTFVNFKLFIKNILSELYYHNKPKTFKAVLMNNLKKIDSKRHFIRGIISEDFDGGKYLVKSFDNQSSSNLTGLSKSNALIILEESRTNPKAGDETECMMI